MQDIAVMVNGSRRGVKKAVKVTKFCVTVRNTQTFDGAAAVGNSVHQFVAVSESRIGDIFVLEMCCICEALGARGFDVATVSAIMFGGGGKIPAINRVERPCSTFVRLLVDLDLAPHRGERHLVVIKWTVEVGIRGDGRGGVGLA